MQLKYFGLIGLLAFLLVDHSNAQTVVPVGTLPNRAAELAQLNLNYIEDEGQASSEPCVEQGIGPGLATPPGIARALRAIMTGMYDTWTRYDDIALPSLNQTFPREPPAERTLANKQAAITYAKYFVDRFLFPQRLALDNTTAVIMTRYGVDLTDETPRPAQVAKAMTDPLIALLSNDSSNQAGCYADTTNYMSGPAVNLTSQSSITASALAVQSNPFLWSPLVEGDSVQFFLMPQAYLMPPFAVSDLLPPPPPNATQWREYYLNLIPIQQTLQDDNSRPKIIADYWANLPTAPPGYFVDLVLTLVARLNMNLDDTVKLLFLVANAEYDAAINTWHAKILYNTVRPATYIPLTLNSTQILSDQYRGAYCPLGDIAAWQWQPYQPTPAFPEYTSAHSAFAYAASEVLQGFFNSSRIPGGPIAIPIARGSSHAEPLCSATGIDAAGQPCQFRVCPFNSNFTSANNFVPSEDMELGPFITFEEIAADMSGSRLFAGQHIQIGDVEGRNLGSAVGVAVLDKALALFRGQTS